MHEQVTLTRDCSAIEIPDGTRTTLSEGARVTIMQTLGDTFTVMTERGRMVRIADTEADALGVQVSHRGENVDSGRPLEEQVWDALRTCYDPEIPVNIVDLGLVYECRITRRDEGGIHVDIVMTLTAPGCGMGNVLADDIRRKLLGIDDIRHVEVDVVFEPPWDRSRMSEAAQLKLGMF